MERLKSHSDFVAVLKRRRKVSCPDFIVHYAMRDDSQAHGHVATNSRRIGLAVSKVVGNAVTRNTVKRRFRVLAHRYEHHLPEGTDVVLRAKPSAAAASFQKLDKQMLSGFDAVAARNGGSANGAGLP